MPQLGPPLQSAAMTMLWVNSSSEVSGRACKTQSMYYACNSNVATPRVPGLRISMLQAELRSVLTKKQGDDADDDSGLPRSPGTPPDSTRLHAHKGQTGKSGGSCSDGSMLSIYSSGTGTGTDEDIFGPLSDHSSRLSLSRDQDSLDLKPAGALSHAAAKHRIAVRPRRNHGVSRPRRPGPPPATLPATLEEETTSTDPSPQDAVDAGQGAERGRATLPATGAADRPTPVQRSRSTLADRRLRDLSPRKLWGRDASEPAEKKSEGFFSRLFGSRRSGRKRKSGGKEAEEAPRAQPRRQTPEEESRPPPVPVSADRARPALSTEVLLNTGAVGRPADGGTEAVQQGVAAAGAPARDSEVVCSPLQEETARFDEDATPASPQQEEVQEGRRDSRQEGLGQRSSPEVAARPPSLHEAAARPLSKSGDIAESVSQSQPEEQPAQEPVPAESAPAPAPAEFMPASASVPAPAPDQCDQESRGDAAPEEEDGDESPPVLRRRRVVPEHPSADRSSQARQSSSSQKLSWMEAELRKTPARDDNTPISSSGHELRKTWVKEEAPKTPSSADEEVQRTPSWVKEELRKTPPSGHELRKTWIKDQPKTPPSVDSETRKTPPWMKEELRKSASPLAVEETPRTPSWVTEELQRSTLSSEDPSPAVPVRPLRVRPVRRPVSSADPTLPSAAGHRRSQDLPSSQAGAEPRRRSSALALGRAEPVSPVESGPRSLDSALLLSAGRREPPEVAERHRSAPDAPDAPDADPAVSSADGERLGGRPAGQTAASSSSSERLSDGGSGGSGNSSEKNRASVDGSTEDIGRSMVSETFGDFKLGSSPGTVRDGLVADGEGVNQSESVADSGKESGKPGSEDSLMDSLESIPTDSGKCDDVGTPEENPRRSVNASTPDKPEVPAKPRKISDSEAADRPADGVVRTEKTPATPDSQGASGRPNSVEESSGPSTLDRTAASDQDSGMPEFMKIHLHRVETPVAMTTQVVVPKPKPRDPLSRPVAAGQTEQTANKLENKPENKSENKPENRPDSLLADVPEVVLVEKHHPRQVRPVSQLNPEHPTASSAKPVHETPSSPESAKVVPEVPARPTLPSTNKTPEPVRSPTLCKQSVQNADDSEAVVLRRKPAALPAADSPDSELLKVFKRRSLKLVAADEPAPRLTAAADADAPLRVATDEKENERPRTEVVTASVSPSEARATWSHRSVSMPIGGPKSPVARESGPPSGGFQVPESAPVRPDRPRKPPPPTQPRSAAAVADGGATVATEPARVRSAPDATCAPSVAQTGAGQGSDKRVSHADDDSASTADWLKQTVRERREQREQREQQHMRKIGQKELIIEPDVLVPGRTPAPRSSRVLEMANTFQKLQPT